MYFCLPNFLLRVFRPILSQEEVPNHLCQKLRTTLDILDFYLKPLATGLSISDTWPFKHNLLDQYIDTQPTFECLC